MTSVNEFLKKCTVLKNTSKKATNFLNNYHYSIARYGYRTLNDCYSSYSVFKGWAYRYICQECEKYNGYGMTIPSYNCMNFTQAYLITDGINDWLIYHTPDNTYAIQMPD